MGAVGAYFPMILSAMGGTNFQRYENLPMCHGAVWKWAGGRIQRRDFKIFFWFVTGLPFVFFSCTFMAKETESV